MSKIEKLKRYRPFFTKNAKKLWIVNGCWWDGWVDFDDVIDDLFIYLIDFEGFDATFFKKLNKDINVLCNEHDLDYFFQKWFYKSNFIFALSVCKLINSWTSFFEKICVFFTLFFGLNKFWKKYYKKAKNTKKDFMTWYKLKNDKEIFDYIENFDWVYKWVN